jgi:hypothetical protein
LKTGTKITKKSSKKPPNFRTTPKLFSMNLPSKLVTSKIKVKKERN